MATETLPAQMTDEELVLHAFSVLARELGLAGYARFLRLVSSGRGDYTAERYERMDNVTVADVVGRLEQRNAAQRTSGS
jgi:hypothetical protein